MKLAFLLVLFFWFLSWVIPREAEPATGCGYPSSLDTFTNVSSGTILTAADYNKLLCAVERLESLLTLPRYTVATLPASPVIGQKAMVTDGLDTSTCIAGGGTAQNECTFKTGGWVVTTGGAGGGAPTAGPYITKTSDGGLSNEFALSTLATGILRNTTGTGIPTIATPGIDYLAPASPSSAFPQSVVSGSGNYCTSATGTDAYACTTPSAFTSYEIGAEYVLKADVANVGTATVAFNGITPAVGIRKWSGGALITLVNNDIGTGQITSFIYDGTFMILSGTGGAGGTGGVSGSGTAGQFTVWSGATTAENADFLREDATGPIISGVARFGTTGTNELAESYASITGLKTRAKRNVSGNEAVNCGTETLGDLVKYDSTGCLTRAGKADKLFLFQLGGDDTGDPVLVDTLDQLNIFPNDYGQGITINQVKCYSNAGTPSINIQRDDGSPANILSSNLSCSVAGATGTIDTNEDNIAAGEKIGFVMVSAGGVAKRIIVSIRYTMD